MKTILKRISAGVLAAIFLATFAVPRSKAVVGEGFDIVAAASAVVATHMASLGGEFLIEAGGSSALAAGTENLFMQAGAAGAFGAGVTGAAAMSTIAAGLNAFAGGYLLGSAAYQVVTQFVDWLKASGKIAAGETAQIYISGGAWNKLADGKPIASSNSHTDPYVQGQIYMTQAGSAFRVTTVDTGEFDKNHSKIYKSTMTAVDVDNKVHVYEDKGHTVNYGPDDSSPYYIGSTSIAIAVLKSWYNSSYGAFIPSIAPEVGYAWDRVFGDSGGEPVEKREITYTSPATWTPPAPKPGQSVLYKPFPNAPDKGLEDIIADVPESIASSNFKPAAPTVIETPTPEQPPTPEVPPTVNPNPDVEAPEDVTPYTVKIGEVFPFCIPFDLYHMVTMFSADPEAPNGKWEFYLPWEKQDPHPQLYKVEWDLEKFDDLAELCRKLELVLFCVGLAVVTSRLIKW